MIISSTAPLEDAANLFRSDGSPGGIRLERARAPNHHHRVLAPGFLSPANGDGREQEALIRDALTFDDGISPDAEYLSTTCLALWRSSKDNSTNTTVTTSAFEGKYTKILRNGKPLKNGSNSIPKGMARFTFLSDSHYPVSKTVRAEDLYKVRIDSDALVDGGCKIFVSIPPKVGRIR